LYKSGFVSCVCFAAAGMKIENRDHCEPMAAELGLRQAAAAFIVSTLFKDDRKIDLDLERVNKSVQFLTARNCNDVLHSAELRLTKPDERAAFVAAIPDREDDERQAIARELVQMLDRFRKAVVAADDGQPDDKDRKDSAATRLVQLTEDAQLIHNADGEGFAIMSVDGHKETWALKSKGFKRWLQRRFFEEYGKAPGSQAVQDALGVIEGKALYDGPERRIFIRIGEKDGKIYLDLADDKWRAVEIDANDWRVVDVPPIEFKRTRGMLPLPVPERGGAIKELQPFLYFKDGDLSTLTVGSLVMKYNPRGPYPVDALIGRNGSGKSLRARFIRDLIDPCTAPARTAPREVRDLAIASSNEWLPTFDNLSSLPEWLSDALCCVSTGGGLRTRELWTNDDEAIFSFKRPQILTSITEVVSRPDLLDRAIIYDLPAIPGEDKKDEETLLREFEQARPRILGAVL